jgi:S1-C subfamily serine protease
MKRVTLYSSSSRSRPAGWPHRAEGAETSGRDGEGSDAAFPALAGDRPPSRVRRFLARRGRVVLVTAVALLALMLAYTFTGSRPAPQRLTQEDIDAAVLRTLETKPLPSPAAKAYEVIRPSVVRVRGLTLDEIGGEEIEQGVGSGVVIVDKGVILTNLHVVAGAKRVKVVFFDGFESDAEVVGLRPEHDLAVLQAKSIPDDLVAATMRSTQDLAVGDRVVAVGFPFGIGPSVSAGVVSGLKRDFLSPEGKRVLTNLIQFDAAANPGSSGGPLVTSEGEVVGIVTAILNPSDQRVFIGIGFAVPIENAASAAGVHPF